MRKFAPFLAAVFTAAATPSSRAAELPAGRLSGPAHAGNASASIRSGLYSAARARHSGWRAPRERDRHRLFGADEQSRKQYLAIRYEIEYRAKAAFAAGRGECVGARL